jgi:hypothetical protein
MAAEARRKKEVRYALQFGALSLFALCKAFEQKNEKLIFSRLGEPPHLSKCFYRR